VVARPYHSASSAKLGARCERAWAYRYVLGYTTPRIAWNDTQPAIPAWADASRVDRTRALSRQRSTALGEAVHARLEAWYTPGATVNWHDLPGQIALSGAHLLPHPTRCFIAKPEIELGTEPLRYDGQTDDSPARGFEFGGVMWAGYTDLVVLPLESESVRLSLPPRTGVVYDYKTTASIAQYALTPATLATDLQACLYALAHDANHLRWLYLETKRVRRATPVDACISRDQAEAVVGPAAELCRRLDVIASVDDAEPNLDACADYGGCEYHITQGGPCNVRRSVSQLVSARVKKERTTMPLTPEQQAKFDALKKPKTAPAPATLPAPAPADTGAEVTVSAPPEAPPPVETPAAPPPAPKAKAPRKAPAGSFAELAAELAATEAALAEANTKLEAAKDAMRKALA